MSKILSAEAEHRPCYNQTDGADWRDDGDNLYSGTALDSASIQPGSDFLYKPCYLSGGICAGNESLHDQLSDLYAAWHGGRSGIFGFTAGVGKLAGPTGGYLVGFILMALIVGFS